MARMKELEAENICLKKKYADVQLQNDVITEAMAKMYGEATPAIRSPTGGHMILSNSINHKFFFFQPTTPSRPR